MTKQLELSEPPSPWLNFFQEVRRLAAKLDSLEQKKITEDGERLS